MRSFLEKSQVTLTTRVHHRGRITIEDRLPSYDHNILRTDRNGLAALAEILLMTPRHRSSAEGRESAVR